MPARYTKHDRWKPSRKRTIAQQQVTSRMKAQSTHTKGLLKENIPPAATVSSTELTLPNAILPTSKNFHIRYRNERLMPQADQEAASQTQADQQSLAAAQTSLTAAKSEAKHLQERNEILTKRNHALGMRVSRAPLQKAHAVKKATARTIAQTTKHTTFALKNKNIITDTVCDTICKLVATHDVPVSSVRGVFGVIADCLGIAVEGDVSTRSIGRVLQEADVAANVQMVDEMMEVDGVTLSGDGTSHKNVNYQSHHITYTSHDGKGVTRFVGIQHEVNHTSETQLQGWKDVLHDMCDTYNTCMAGEKAVADPREVVSKVKGMLTDHAEDQKKLVRLFSDWKRTSLLWQTTEGVITTAGGMEAWEALTAGEQHLRSSEALRQLKLTIGQEKFDGLTESAKESIDFFIWAGCCMHKDLNAVKGGNTRMQSWWAHHSIDGPILLMNRDNAAAALGGSSIAQARALHVSQRGAAKALALAGAVFRHKD
ncbi:hypothetical protein DFJ58DRAFT_728297 [Suillus subalutaceus]|uniref:uncharacterized protein n=1 Tax=Suillus subalutaceus TaxID=48586 RepID=UPI001B85FA49|nr:uncharacterized protein DFJ58DRAFT_728297 [Suillus subalutaceus]KAG1853184.1 hypothetical protein DFJ58DRAFT_728297 [Suillus subalutaceus]